ncbi:glycosyltransferase family 4 protein [Desulfocurvus vexinensis]|uniref:glycosyltransferase family 4 protein n=1 Tax=Desulfocurvus vexinensis TaxID=399548 RepID=UPI00048EC4E9|nr:glycosyltransferase family 1 protein [Desulfocurvus vexinensis]
MRIAICTDAWQPQTSGVVTTLNRMTAGLAARGHEVLVVHPGLFRSVPCPTYPDIRLAVLPGRRLGRLLDEFAPQAVAVPAEGPLGLAARNHCLRRGWPFTTAFMTRFPDYVRLRSGMPEAWTFRALRWFHRPAAATMVSTPSLREELSRRGFANLRHWGRGVDTELFCPRGKAALDLPRPIAMYMGRVAVEKNLDAFLGLDLPGSKVVIGDGPALEAMRRRYPAARFLGRKTGLDLAVHLDAADVFVFPSRTDTFGIVLIEAMACGVPVAAYPVPGPRDVVAHGRTGWLDEDLSHAVDRALAMDPAQCRALALEHTWERSVEQFLGNLVPIA